MTLLLPIRFPKLLLFGLATLAVDLAVSVMLAGGDNGAGTVMLFQIAGFLGWLGGLEAIGWMTQDSPWARRGPQNLSELRQALQSQLEPQPKGYVASRMASLKSFDLQAYRNFALRLMSGASFVFLLAALFLFHLAERLPDQLTFLKIMGVIMFIRLVPLACASTFVGPLLLAVIPRRPTRADLLNAGVGFGCAALALFQVWSLKEPPVADFLLAVLHAGFDIFGWPYGLMIGGLVWLSLSMASGRET